MSWKNEEKCPKLQAIGVNLNESAYKFNGLGRPSKKSVVERNAVKKICLNCSYSHCIYDRNN